MLDVCVSQRVISDAKDKISSLSFRDGESRREQLFCTWKSPGWMGSVHLMHSISSCRKRAQCPGLVFQFSTLSECCSRIMLQGESSEPQLCGSVLLYAPGSPALVQHSLHQKTQLKKKKIIKKEHYFRTRKISFFQHE